MSKIIRVSSALIAGLLTGTSSGFAFNLDDQRDHYTGAVADQKPQTASQVVEAKKCAQKYLQNKKKNVRLGTTGNFKGTLNGQKLFFQRIDVEADGDCFFHTVSTTRLDANQHIIEAISHNTRVSKLTTKLLENYFQDGQVSEGFLNQYSEKRPHTDAQYRNNNYEDFQNFSQQTDVLKNFIYWTFQHDKRWPDCSFGASQEDDARIGNYVDIFACAFNLKLTVWGSDEKNLKVLSPSCVTSKNAKELHIFHYGRGGLHYQALNVIEPWEKYDSHLMQFEQNVRRATYTAYNEKCKAIKDEILKFSKNFRNNIQLSIAHEYETLTKKIFSYQWDSINGYKINPHFISHDPYASDLDLSTILDDMITDAQMHTFQKSFLDELLNCTINCQHQDSNCKIYPLILAGIGDYKEDNLEIKDDKITTCSFSLKNQVESYRTSLRRQITDTLKNLIFTYDEARNAQARKKMRFFESATIEKFNLNDVFPGVKNALQQYGLMFAQALGRCTDGAHETLQYLEEDMRSSTSGEINFNKKIGHIILEYKKNFLQKLTNGINAQSDFDQREGRTETATYLRQFLRLPLGLEGEYIHIAHPELSIHGVVDYFTPLNALMRFFQGGESIQGNFFILGKAYQIKLPKVQPYAPSLLVSLLRKSLDDTNNKGFTYEHLNTYIEQDPLLNTHFNEIFIECEKEENEFFKNDHNNMYKDSVFLRILHTLGYILKDGEIFNTSENA